MRRKIIQKRKYSVLSSRKFEVKTSNSSSSILLVTIWSGVFNFEILKLNSIWISKVKDTQAWLDKNIMYPKKLKIDSFSKTWACRELCLENICFGFCLHYIWGGKQWVGFILFGFGVGNNVFWLQVHCLALVLRTMGLPKFFGLGVRKNGVSALSS